MSIIIDSALRDLKKKKEAELKDFIVSLVKAYPYPTVPREFQLYINRSKLNCHGTTPIKVVAKAIIDKLDSYIKEINNIEAEIQANLNKDFPSAQTK